MNKKSWWRHTAVSHRPTGVEAAETFTLPYCKGLGFKLYNIRDRFPTEFPCHTPFTRLIVRESFTHTLQQKRNGQTF